MLTFLVVGLIVFATFTAIEWIIEAEFAARQRCRRIREVLDHLDRKNPNS